MIQNEQKDKFLLDEVFSNGASFEIKEDSLSINRNDYLLKIAQDKTILHLGFVDHLPLIDEKIKNGAWLHKKLIDVSALCYGVDINNEGIEYLHSQYGFNNLYCVDVTSDIIPEAISSQKFDYMFIPDVIEHIGNPVDFLVAIKENFQGNIEKIILTTPNAFRWNNFINSFKNKEVINTDHRFWFTPYTLSKIVSDAGYQIIDLKYAEHGRLSRREIIKKMILKKYPLFRDTLIMEVEL